MTITMYDSINPSQIPQDAEAVAGYVDGNWPTYPTLRAKFPHAYRLSVAVFAADDAEALDIENFDAWPGQAPGWVSRQQARGVRRPVLYCSVSKVADVLGALAKHRIARSQVRLWSAHYGVGEHICAPSTCGYPGLKVACDGTQWTDHALGRNLDQSALVDSFFPATRLPEEPMLLLKGQGAATPIALPTGTRRLRFFSNAPAQVRVDLIGVSQPSVNLDLGYSKGAQGIAAHGAIAAVAHRLDDGNNEVSFVPVL